MTKGTVTISQTDYADLIMRKTYLDLIFSTMSEGDESARKLVTKIKEIIDLSETRVDVDF